VTYHGRGHIFIFRNRLAKHEGGRKTLEVMTSTILLETFGPVVSSLGANSINELLMRKTSTEYHINCFVRIPSSFLISKCMLMKPLHEICFIRMKQHVDEKRRLEPIRMQNVNKTKQICCQSETGSF
jgi:hypothetical protein